MHINTTCKQRPYYNVLRISLEVKMYVTYEWNYITVHRHAKIDIVILKFNISV